jgi:hypothetical protein
VIAYVSDGEVPTGCLLRTNANRSESKTGNLSIVPESTLVLRQRDFLVGDIVKEFCDPYLMLGVDDHG